MPEQGQPFRHKTSQWEKIKPSDLLTPEQMRRLKSRSDAWGLWLTLHPWLVIAAMITLAVQVPHPLTWLLAIVIIGGRQLGLAIVMHEASHGMLFKTRKYNEFAGNWLTGAPVLVDMSIYRPHHMSHHRFTRTERDPDDFLYRGFPLTKVSMARKVLRDLIGWTFVRSLTGMAFALTSGAEKTFTAKFRAWWAYYRNPMIANAVMLGGAALAGYAEYYVWFWLIPLMTFNQLFLRLRNMGEHSHVTDLTDPLQNTRTVTNPGLWRALNAPYWVNYHIEHHLFTFAPCYRLREAHEILKSQPIYADMEIRNGYGEVLRHLTGRESAATPAE